MLYQDIINLNNYYIKLLCMLITFYMVLSIFNVYKYILDHIRLK